MCIKKHYIVVFVFLLLIFNLVGCNKKMENINKEESEVSTQVENSMIYVHIGNTRLEILPDNNSSVKALFELLDKEDIFIEMKDYGGFEKSGDLEIPIVTNDEWITTQVGDVVLYQGKTIAIYYDANTYSLTRLGKIRGFSKESLQAIFSDEAVEVRLSRK